MQVVRNEWSLRSTDAGTVIALNFYLAARFWPLGALLERTMMRREVGKSIALILNGLKHHVETDEVVGAELPANAVVAATVRW